MTTSHSEIVLAGGESPRLSFEDAENAVHDAVADFGGQWRRTLHSAIGVGQALIELREVSQHGEFLPWLRDHFELGQRMAYNFINLAENLRFTASLPPGTGVTAAVKALAASKREAKPTPEHDDGVVDLVLEPALLRYCPAGMPTHVIVRQMVNVFFPDAITCLDSTYGEGNFWSGSSPVKVTAHDLDEQRAPDGVMDFTRLSYDDATFDLVVFDPPHLADGGDESVMAGKFGTVATQEALEELITNGAREAWRVSRLGIVVKITDHVHGHTFQDMAMLVCDALATWPYDKVHQVRDHAFIDPSWGEQCSAYSNGSTYLIFRKGDQRHVVRRR